jgi:hypothetical protein
LARRQTLLFIALFATTASLAGCELASLIDSGGDDSDNDNGGVAEEPSYTGEYAGAVDVSNSETGESWEGPSATMTITYQESDGDVDVSFSILDLPSQGDRIDGTLTNCSPGPSFVICSDREGSQLLSVELTFSSSTAAGKITDSREQPDGQFKIVLEATGSFAKQ